MSLVPPPSPIDVRLRCHGCAATVDPLDPVTASASIGRCPNADRAPDVDHVLGWDPVLAGVPSWPADEQSLNPFVRYRTLQHWYALGRARGLTDADLVSAVTRIDRSVGAVDGHGFVVSPLFEDEQASAALGIEVWGKDETGNVSGSHKARHLMGLALHLDVMKTSVRARLAIASCGNAALAAAVLAKATRRPLDVFVPPSASGAITERLRALGATLTECSRRPDDPPGDPCLHRFREARRRGAVPFCVQGPENGLTIDGGTTLAYELASQWSMLGSVPERLFVPVGGGALGVALAHGLDVAVRLGAISHRPPLHCVQSEGAAPLHRAWRAVARRAATALGERDDDSVGDEALAARLTLPDAAEAIDGTLGFAATHRSRFMWPWEDEPSSVATGIVDDETYDWLALVRAMIATGGRPLVVREVDLVQANAMTSANADYTGTAALAGAVALRARGELRVGERIGVLYTGVRRG